MCGWVCGCLIIAYKNQIRCLPFAFVFPLRGIKAHRRTPQGRWILSPLSRKQNRFVIVMAKASADGVA